jgi:acetyl esterase/lipase
MPYGRSYIAPVALDLVSRGFAVWSLEYRRVGGVGGGWPGTLQDVGAGIDHLATLAAEGVDVDLARVTAIGHSAGGQLALWCAQRDSKRAADDDYAPKRVRFAAAVGLAPVADLALAYELGCGSGAVGKFLDGSPTEHPQRYRTYSPIEILPLGVPQLLIHGTVDEDVPVEISRRYHRAAQAAGDDVRFIEPATASHMALVNVNSEAYATLCRWLLDTEVGS